VRSQAARNGHEAVLTVVPVIMLGCAGVQHNPAVSTSVIGTVIKGYTHS
jgi:hypothetical protein